MKQTISKAARLRTEKAFAERMKTLGIKYGTKTYMKMQCEFFVGAMAALNGMHAYWAICISSGREILKAPK